MRTSPGTRIRVALASAAAIGLALLAPVPANAAGGTPSTPTELFNALEACSTDPSAPVYVAGRGGLAVEGIPSDTDPSVTDLTEQVQYWPVSDPTQITIDSHSAFPGSEATVNLLTLADGQTYAWQARTVDPSGAASAWSAPCYVTDDDSAPAAAPTVTSANYPQWQWDQSGAPIQFTFGANGVSDVAGFEYSWNGSFPSPSASIGDHGIPQFHDPYSVPNYAVRAATLGGSGTVSLVPPAGLGGWLTLWVRSLDRAFNPSPTVTYNIWLKPNGPTVSELSHSPQFGAPASFKLTADPKLQAASPVVSFTVVHRNWQGGSTTTVPASAAGSAVVNIPLDGQYGDDVIVSSTSANGWVSETTWWNNGFLDTSPTVSSDVYAENGSSGGAGVPGTFTFTPKVKGADVASYTYSFNWGQPTTITAGAHGDAQISWTPDQSGWCFLEVYATTKDGIQLTPYDYSFTVN